jgi:5-methylcytosine-specific restriction endonuclease McrA
MSNWKNNWTPKELTSAKRKAYLKFMNSPAWQRTRSFRLGLSPICQIMHSENCQPGFPAPATAVDHIIPAEHLPEWLWANVENTQSSCKACNSWKQRQDKRRGAELRQKAIAFVRKWSAELGKF